MKIREEIIEIDIEKIKPNKFFNRSFDIEKLKKMAETIKAQGIINLSEVDENNTIITGELRWRSAKLAGLKTIKVKRISGLTEFEKMCRCFIENRHRQNMTYAEEIEAIRKLLSYLKSFAKRKGRRGPRPVQKELAKALGLSEQWLSNILRVERKGIDELKAKTEKGMFSATDAIRIANLPVAVQTEIIKEVKSNKIEESKLRKVKRFVAAKETDSIERLITWLEKSEDMVDVEVEKLEQDEILLIKKHFEVYLLPFYEEVCRIC
jgi:ParB/RepB/Spo0J family partition protein